jgi:hypothetical protein
MYLDRIYGATKYSHLERASLKSLPQLTCLSCKQHIGTPINYAKENRLAYRLFVDAVQKKVVSSNKAVTV